MMMTKMIGELTMTMILMTTTMMMTIMFAEFTVSKLRFKWHCSAQKGPYTRLHSVDRLAGLVVKASASRAEDPGFQSRLSRDFSWSSHTRDLKIGTPAATLPGTWNYRVSAGTGWPGVCIL